MEGLRTRSYIRFRVRKLSGYKFTSGNIGRAGVSCPSSEFAADCLFFPLYRDLRLATLCVFALLTPSVESLGEAITLLSAQRHW